MWKRQNCYHEDFTNNLDVENDTFKVITQHDYVFFIKKKQQKTALSKGSTIAEKTKKLQGNFGLDLENDTLKVIKQHDYQLFVPSRFR